MGLISSCREPIRSPMAGDFASMDLARRLPPYAPWRLPPLPGAAFMPAHAGCFAALAFDFRAGCALIFPFLPRDVFTLISMTRP